MGHEARAAGNRVGLAMAHARGPAILMAVVAAFGVGGAVTVYASARITDPGVQGALVGGIAGFGGGILGAIIGAWASRDVASRTIADARRARQEAHKVATASMFLQERRAAIVAVLAAGEAAARESQQAALSVTADSPSPRTDLLDDFRRNWLELILLAPDLTSGEGGAYSAAVAQQAGAFASWTFRQINLIKRGVIGGGPLPREVTDAISALDSARAAFLVAAMKHLGVTA
jgi:hypothetical protein